MSESSQYPIRNRYILLADLVLIAVSAWAAYALRFDWLFSLTREEFPIFLACVLLVKPLVFHAFGLYRRYWRYASVWDLVAVVLASSAATMVVAVVMFALRVTAVVPGFPRTVVPIDWLLTLTLAGGARMAVRALAEMADLNDDRHGPTLKRVLIAGAGNAGLMVAREMQRNPHLGMRPVGFVDDDPVKQRKIILGIKVLGKIDSVQRVALAQRVQEVIIAMPTAPGTVVRAIVDRCREAQLESMVIPGVFELLDGKVSVNRLRKVEISDLLRRSQVEIGVSNREYVRGRIVVVTGAGGSIGSELCRQVAGNQPRRLILMGHGENSVFDIQMQLRERFPGLDCAAVIADVRDRDRMDQVFDRFRPDLVFHAAAHKHVPLMEDNPEEAISNNVVGTCNVVNAALRVGVERLVMISTDKAVSPTSIMGASKRAAELVVRDAARRSGKAFVVVRFGNVLGSRGSVVPIFNRQIEQGGPIRITHPDMRRFFMTIPEAVHLVLQAGGMGAGAELFVLDMGEPVRIVQLAEDLIKLSGLNPSDVPIEFTGLRPGEKLEETLWEDGSMVDETTHHGVRRIIEPSTEGVIVDDMVEALQRAAASGDPMIVQAEFARWISSYAPALPETTPVPSFAD